MTSNLESELRTYIIALLIQQGGEPLCVGRKAYEQARRASSVRLVMDRRDSETVYMALELVAEGGAEPRITLVEHEHRRLTEDRAVKRYLTEELVSGRWVAAGPLSLGFRTLTRVSMAEATTHLGLALEWVTGCSRAEAANSAVTLLLAGLEPGQSAEESALNRSQHCQLGNHSACPRETTLGTGPCLCDCHGRAPKK